MVLSASAVFLPRGAGAPRARSARHSVSPANRLALPRLSVLVEACDLAYWTPSHWTKLALRIPDRHQRIRLDIRREFEDCAYFILEKRVNRREHGTQSEGAACEDDVLDGGVNTRAPDTRLGMCFGLDIVGQLCCSRPHTRAKAWEQQDRCVAHMIEQMHNGTHETFVLLLIHMRGA